MCLLYLNGDKMTEQEIEAFTFIAWIILTFVLALGLGMLTLGVGSLYFSGTTSWGLSILIGTVFTAMSAYKLIAHLNLKKLK